MILIHMTITSTATLTSVIFLLIDLNLIICYRIILLQNLSCTARNVTVIKLSNSGTPWMKKISVVLFINHTQNNKVSTHVFARKAINEEEQEVQHHIKNINCVTQNALALI